MNIDHHEIFVRYLKLLNQLLANLNSQAESEKELLNARLSPDMFPLKIQVKVAASFALRASCRDPNDALADLGEKIESVDGLVSYVQDVIKFIEKSNPYEENEVEDKAGFKTIRMNSQEYIYHFSLPNFFFHLSMVYAIAKNHGLSVTKGDFDGLHEYPAGFSWEADAE